MALQATAVSAWAHHPGEEDAAADDEAHARRANEAARARAQKAAAGTAPGEPMSAMLKRMLKRPEGTLFVLFAAMIAPFWLAAHIGLGSIGFFWQVGVNVLVVPFLERDYSVGEIPTDRICKLAADSAGEVGPRIGVKIR